MPEFEIEPKSLQRIFEHLHDAEDNEAGDEMETLVTVARAVVADWQTSRLAEHVRQLAALLKEMGAYDQEYTDEEL